MEALKEVTCEQFCVNNFVEHVNNTILQYWTKAKYTIPMPRVVANILSEKWIRLENQELRDNGKGGMEYRTTSVYGFIARQDYTTKVLGSVVAGGIYRAAGFKAPAKHARGNIFDATTYSTCATAQGIVYLPEGRKAKT